MKSALQNTFLVWVVITLLVLASLAAIYLRNGVAGLNLFIQEWPLSNLAVTLASTALTWLLSGVLLYLLANEKINNIKTEIAKSILDDVTDIDGTTELNTDLDSKPFIDYKNETIKGDDETDFEEESVQNWERKWYLRIHKH